MTSVKDLITTTEQGRDLMPLPSYDTDKIMIGEKTYSTDIIGISTVYNDDTTGNYLGMKIDDGGAFESKMQPNQPEHPNTHSIVVGFAISGILILYFIACAYILYRKWQSHVRTNRKLQQSVNFPSISTSSFSSHVRLPIQSLSSNSSLTTNNAMQPILSIPLSSTGSLYFEDFSFDAFESSNAGNSHQDNTYNDYEKELTFTTSLDEQSWYDFQRRRSVFENNGIKNDVDVPFQTEWDEDDYQTKNQNISTSAVRCPTCLNGEILGSKPSSNTIQNTQKIHGYTFAGLTFPYGDETNDDLIESKLRNELGGSCRHLMWDDHNASQLVYRQEI